MADVQMMIDDPSLTTRGPGEEFALAYARMGGEASVTLRAAISDMFPPAQRRPRYTVRHLLRKAVIGAGSDTVNTFLERALDIDDQSAAPEWDFEVGVLEAPIGVVRAAVPVPEPVLNDPAALAAFVDFRLLVRLGTAENDALLNGDGSDGITGLLRTRGVRQLNEPRDTVAETLLHTAALCEWYGGSADGIVMHPDDWWPLMHEGGILDGLHDAGVKVSRTRMVPAGQALVGDFSSAATLLDQHTSVIRLTQPGEISELPPGMLGLMAEIHEGFAVHLPGHFVLSTLPTVGGEPR